MLHIVRSKFLIEMSVVEPGQSSGAIPRVIVIVRHSSPLKLLLSAGLERAS